MNIAPLTLRRATDYGAQILDWLAPYSHHAQLAGSIRRDRPTCGDVDVVMIPRLAVEQDMFGVETGRRNLCWEFLDAYVRESRGRARILSGATPGAEWSSYGLPWCQLDVFFCTPDTLVTTLVCRTGSKEHNVFICQRAKDLGLRWNPARGLFRLGTSGEEGLDAGPIPLRTEKDFYAALKLPFITPANREAGWLLEHIAAVRGTTVTSAAQDSSAPPIYYVP